MLRESPKAALIMKNNIKKRLKNFDRRELFKQRIEKI